MSVAMIGPKFYAWGKDGKPLSFGKLYTYAARTNDPKNTYQSEDQVVANTNPVILNGEGYANVYLSGSYKMALKDSDDNEVWSADPVTASQPEEWVTCLPATYLSPSSFEVSGNFTSQYDIGRSVRINNNAANYAYSTIKSASFAANKTTITIADSSVTTGIQEVCVSIVGLNSVPQGPGSVAEMKELSLIVSSSISTKGFYSPGDGGEGDYIIEPIPAVADGYVDHVMSNGTVARLQIKDSLKFKQAGLSILNNDVVNTLSIQAALDYGVPNIEFPNTYESFLFSSFTIRENTTVNFNTVTLRSTITSGVAIKTESLSRSNMRLYGNRSNIVADVATNDVDLLQIGGNVFVEVDGLVFFNTAGHPIIIGGENTRDPTSFVISNCETNTGRGLKILAGVVDGIEYNSVTTGTIKDSFWTITGKNEPSINMIANDFAGGGPSSIFGVTIARCSLNSVFEDFGKFVKMKAGGTSNISLVKFDNCEGEIRGESLTNFLVEIEGVDRSYFNIRTRSSDYSSYKFINSSENTIDTDRDSSSNSTLQGLTMIDFDANSGNNIVNNVVGITDQLDTEITSNAPLAPLYYKKYKDANGSNTFSGGLTTNLTRVVRTEALGVYSPAGELINPDYDNPPKAANVWTDNGDGTYTVVCSTTPQSGFNLNVPPSISIGDNMVVRLEYKFASITDLVDGWRLESSTGGTARSVVIPLTTDFVDVAYITKMTARQLRVYHVGAIVPASVTFIIRKFEVFKGKQLPYPHNYQPKDVLTQFEKFPYATTGKLPTTFNIGTQIFDSTVDVLKVWNGSAWV